MRISVIIPAIDESQQIAQAVDAAWRAGAWEVIVVDGGSSDDTCQVASRAGCLLIHSSIGRARQQNAGAQLAIGDVLFFQHADTWPDVSALEQIKEAFADRSVFSGAFRQSIESAGIRYRMLERGNAMRAQRLGLPYGDQGIFVRRHTFLEMGGFPEVALMEDLMLMRRLRATAHPTLLPGPIHVDPRRWKRHGVVRQTLRNWLLVTAFSMGVSPNRLARFYAHHGG